MKNVLNLILVVAALAFFGPSQKGADDDLRGAILCNASIVANIPCVANNGDCDREIGLPAPGFVDSLVGDLRTCGYHNGACDGTLEFTDVSTIGCSPWFYWPA